MIDHRQIKRQGGRATGFPTMLSTRRQSPVTAGGQKKKKNQARPMWKRMGWSQKQKKGLEAQSKDGKRSPQGAPHHSFQRYTIFAWRAWRATWFLYAQLGIPLSRFGKMNNPGCRASSLTAATTAAGRFGRLRSIGNQDFGPLRASGCLPLVFMEHAWMGHKEATCYYQTMAQETNGNTSQDGSATYDD